MAVQAAFEKRKESKKLSQASAKQIKPKPNLQPTQEESYDFFTKVDWGPEVSHTGRNCFNLFQISFSANTADAHPGVSGVSKDQKFCEKFKKSHCQAEYKGWSTS